MRNSPWLWLDLTESAMLIYSEISLLSLSSPPLIKCRWIICGLLHYLTLSLGRKIYYFWFSVWHQDTYTPTSEAHFNSILSCVSCPLDSVQAQDLPHIIASQLLPEASGLTEGNVAWNSTLSFWSLLRHIYLHSFTRYILSSEGWLQAE